MAIPPKPANSNGGASANGNGQGGGAQGQQVQVRVLSQYVKDLSFENPSIGKQMLTEGENPNLGVEVNVNAQRLGDTVYESAITLKAQCNAKAGVLYDFEIVYGGLFDLQNMPEQVLEQFLLVNCPALIFPFLRRMAADVTREGGFPPLLLDPIDFASLYLQRKNQAGAEGGSTANA
jgi:preprotein translocase subunit SecB